MILRKSNTFEKDGITFSANVGEPEGLYSEDNDLITAEVGELLIENLVSTGDKVDRAR